MSQSRQLAAIMFTDIVGFTALMGDDEQKTLKILEKNREIQKPLISKYDGKWIKELGDGVMASFKNASDAVKAAIEIMETCHRANQFQLCTGIHIAEVVFENDDVFGDGVNIAARIQAAAPPGCIFISEAVKKNIANKKGIKTHFVKEERLKNVNHPVRLHQVLFTGSKIIEAEELTGFRIEKSIAVLPFVNMSSDPEQEYFSDGISEEVINMLAQVADLKVIGRTSSFAFKGKNMDLKVIGEQLKVNHILEGSVRRAGNKLRITAQLIETSNGYHLYSRKFDRELTDIFDVQDEISLAILEAIKIELLGDKRNAVLKRDTDNIEAHDQYLLGLFYYNKFTPEAFRQAIDYFNGAVALDERYGLAYAGLSFCFMNLWYFAWVPEDQTLPQSVEAAHQAIHWDGGSAECHVAMGRVKLHIERHVHHALEYYQKANRINPNNPETLIQLAYCAHIMGNRSSATVYASKACDLDPFSLMNIWYASVVPWASGDYDRLLTNANRLLDLEPNFFGGHTWKGFALTGLGKYEESICEFEAACKLNPSLQMYTDLVVGHSAKSDKKKIKEVLNLMPDLKPPGIEGNYYFGIVHVALEQFEEAYEYFDRALAKNEGMLPLMRLHLSNSKSHEFLEHPRTRALIEKIGYIY